MLSRGFTLIEILISMIILSLMLLGLDAMQLTALRAAKSAYYYSVATQQLDVMIERLQLFKNNDWQRQLVIWNKQNAEVLPQGRGTINGRFPNVTITIFWGDKAEDKCARNRIGQSGCLVFPGQG